MERECTKAEQCYCCWINFLKTQEINEGTTAKGLKEAKVKLNYMQLSEEDKKDYQRYIENWRDNEGIIVGNYNKGKYEGREEGEANKEKYGDEKAKEKQLEMAKNCIINGLSIEMTVKITGLTEDEIRNIIL